MYSFLRSTFSNRYQIVEKFDESTNIQTEPRFIFYSAHDGTLLALLSALELQHVGKE